MSLSVSVCICLDYQKYEGIRQRKRQKRRRVSETRKLRWRRQFESTAAIHFQHHSPPLPLLISTGTDCPKVGEGKEKMKR